MPIELSFQKPADLDEIDFALLGVLMRRGRATWADLAEDLGLTAPAIAQRVRRLEDRGVIRQFAAWVAPEYVASVAGFLAVGVAERSTSTFRDAINRLEPVQECHQISGDADYMLKLRAASLPDLERVIQKIRTLPGVTSARSMVVFSTIKESPVLPLPSTNNKPD